MSPTTSRRSIVVASEFLAHLHMMSRASRRQHARIQLKAMRMPFPHTRPGHRWPAARVEDTDATQRQKKRRHPHLPQSLAQPILGWRFHVAQKAERQMKLFLGKPAQAAQMRVERQQRRLATRRKFEANEESFRREH